MIAFEQTSETAGFIIPWKGPDSVAHRVFFRRDPLTGMQSVLAESLSAKAELFFGKTDWELINRTAKESRPNCFFCPERVEQVTPRYPDKLVPGGRLKGDHTILFPNLFPLAALHAVVTIPEDHLLTLQDYDRQRLSDIFVTAGTFLHRLEHSSEHYAFLSINSNHLPPAGASLFHPHFQIFGSNTIPAIPAKISWAAERFYQQHGKCYWSELCKTEVKQGDRWIGRTGAWAWITAFSPHGPNEILAIHETATTLPELKDSDYDSLAQGLGKCLGYLHTQDYSSFNFSLTAADSPTRASNRCVARLITRQNFRAAYRTDDYFLQKHLGIELIIVPPETLAIALRNVFA